MWCRTEAICKVPVLLTVGFLVALSGSILSDKVLADSEQVKLRIRTVEANHIEGINYRRGKSVAGSRKIDVANDIEDLRGKLATLPYQTFRLLSTQERQIPLNSRTEMELEDGHKLFVKPLSKKNKKVCLWLRWNDSGGAEILDTRMHLTMGQSMITGTEKHDNSGVILAVDVSPGE